MNVLPPAVAGNSVNLSKIEYVPVGSFRISKRSNANLVSPGAVNATARLKLQQVMLFLSQWNVYASSIADMGPCHAAGRARIAWLATAGKTRSDKDYELALA